MLKALAAAEKVARYRHAQLSAVKIAGELKSGPADGATLDELLERIKHQLDEARADPRVGGCARAAGVENGGRLDRGRIESVEHGSAFRGLSPAGCPLGTIAIKAASPHGGAGASPPTSPSCRSCCVARRRPRAAPSASDFSFWRLVKVDKAVKPAHDVALGAMRGIMDRLHQRLEPDGLADIVDLPAVPDVARAPASLASSIRSPPKRRHRLAEPAGYILAALQALAPFLGGVAMAGRRRHRDLALSDLALDGSGEPLVPLDGLGVHVVEVRPEPLVGLCIAELVELASHPA